MTIMAVLLGILFVGLTVVAIGYDLRPTRGGWRVDRGDGRRRPPSGSDSPLTYLFA